MSDADTSGLRHAGEATRRAARVGADRIDDALRAARRRSKARRARPRAKLESLHHSSEVHELV